MTNQEKHRDLLPLLMSYKDQLYAHILVLVPIPSAADDIMQETVIVIWEKFSEFEKGTDFLAWARTIAYYKVQEYRTKKKKAPLAFDDELLQQLYNEPEEMKYTDPVFDVLSKCLKNLSVVESKIVKLRFMEEMKIKNIADSWGKAPSFVYRMMARILYKLRICIQTHGDP